MMRRSSVALALIALAPVVDGRERLEIRARPAFSFAPAEVQLEFRITPDLENRRSSLIELQSERAQRVVPLIPIGAARLPGQRE